MNFKTIIEDVYPALRALSTVSVFEIDQDLHILEVTEALEPTVNKINTLGGKLIKDYKGMVDNSKEEIKIKFPDVATRVAYQKDFDKLMNMELEDEVKAIPISWIKAIPKEKKGIINGEFLRKLKPVLDMEK